MLRLAVFAQNRFSILIHHHLGTQFVHKRFRDIFSHICPYIDYLVVTFAVGNQTLLILVMDILHCCFCLPKKLFLLFRNLHIIYRDRNTTQCSIIETEVFQSIGEYYGTLFAGFPVTLVDHLSDGLLVHNPVNETEHIFDNCLSFRFLEFHEGVFNNISQNYPARCGVHVFPIHTDFYHGMEINCT